MSLSRLVELNSYNPARQFGLYPRKGAIAVGSDADFVVIDLDEEREVTHTGKGTSLYVGWRLRGWPVMTISRGRIVFEDGEVNASETGQGRCVTVPATELEGR
jgi:allantoinase